jgi:hypothetical protein
MAGRLAMMLMPALAALPLLGCGGGSADATTGSCDTRSINGVCEDYTGSSDAVIQYRGACSSGTWKDALCDQTGSVGGCQLVDATLMITITDWEFAPATVASVQQQCQAPSAFVSP